MSETKRYNLTLRKVPKVERDKFRALQRPDTYFEIRPGQEGERVAYSVEMTEAEYARARRDAERPESNLITVEPQIYGEPAYSGPVPDGDTLTYLAANQLAAQGFDGRGVDVGVVDSGLGRALADGVFAGRIKAAWSAAAGVDPLTDTDGHGSAMASLAVPPKARIVVARITDAAGVSPDDAMARSLYWIADDPGADVINISWVYSGETTVLTDAIKHALSKNILIFAARGNYSSSEPVYPAAVSGVLAITNFDRRTDNIAVSSSYGGGVFAASGGMAIWKLEPDGSIGYWEDGGTSSGTALATRIAASLIHNPDKGTKRDPDMVRHYLAKTARKTGASPLYEGNGVLQAGAVINAIRKERPECPPGTEPTTTTTYDIRFVQDASGAVVQVK